MDKDSSNRVNWDEFQEACKKVRYTGDLPGAWRALDQDLSGFITLREIDLHSSDILLRFRKWATDECGSVKSAFQVFDADKSSELSHKEFRNACRIYGFEGDPRKLFKALDSDGRGTLSLDEISFLDEWEIDDEEAGADILVAKENSRSSVARRGSRCTVADVLAKVGGADLSSLPSNGIRFLPPPKLAHVRVNEARYYHLRVRGMRPRTVPPEAFPNGVRTCSSSSQWRPRLDKRAPPEKVMEQLPAFSRAPVAAPHFGRATGEPQRALESSSFPVPGRFELPEVCQRGDVLPHTFLR